jgi:hypothetical protein
MGCFLSVFKERVQGVAHDKKRKERKKREKKKNDQNENQTAVRD